jgi:5-hydroxyisourate hydrolase-like protein (transthyretin family)
MSIRTPYRLALVALVLFLAVGTGSSTTLVLQKKVSVSGALAGRVLVRGTDEPANGVTVEICSSDWKTVLSSTETDKDGHFSLRPPATGRLFYVRVSAPGMDIYQLRVRIDKHATQELTIRLSVAT